MNVKLMQLYFAKKLSFTQPFKAQVRSSEDSYMKAKHILLQFAETPEHDFIDTSIVEYDYILNLNVFKGTKTAAVNYADQQTETFTKTSGEGSDSDNDLKYNLSSLLDTSTQTRTHNEDSDSDARISFSNLMDTSTLTFVNSEISDSDKNIRDIEFLSATRTLTETSEVLDNDR